MLVTLIPLFDDNMAVSAYSLFAQKKNYLLNPSFLSGAGVGDGSVRASGLEVIESMGLETLYTDKPVFVSINNVSIFSNIEEQCHAPHERLVLLIDTSVLPEAMYIKRLKEIKEMGYKLAIRKLTVANFEAYREILRLMDYILLDHIKIDISKAKIYFSSLYPNIKLCAGNIKTKEIYNSLTKDGGYQLYEGEFFRVPVTSGQNEVSPLKVNYLHLLKMVNNPDFDLVEAADVISRDPALVILLLKMVNHIAVNSQITSIRHAAAILGQKELKKWINTAVANELYADKPNEITRLSLLRARFAEKLAPMFGLASQSSELFLMGLFSVLDIILGKPMADALEMVNVSKEIKDALVSGQGMFAQIFDFIKQYESANWQEVSRLMILQNIDMESLYNSYIESLQWYRDLVTN